MTEEQSVKVEGAPGYADFEGRLFAVVGRIDGRGPLGLVIDGDDEIRVIPIKYVTQLTS